MALCLLQKELLIVRIAAVGNPGSVERVDMRTEVSVGQAKLDEGVRVFPELGVRAAAWIGLEFLLEVAAAQRPTTRRPRYERM